MCTGNNKEYMAPSSLHFFNQKARSRFRIRVQVRIHRLKRVNEFIEEQMKQEMEIENLKLYMENMRILKENERLKNKANLLYQENLALSLELEKKKVKL
ncbi:hypothetical protein L1987_81177 [Smallanthus sonchifolius]|uniref:Uncharacterized protein n=1 Tax=Smallanthus sonchifolius TaxID=185202 RepID=A0ACB8YQZ1_9ASTR|nr:hypothetical protein L1987_81177 [Smallanthus sonchifolius]